VQEFVKTVQASYRLNTDKKILTQREHVSACIMPIYLLENIHYVSVVIHCSFNDSEIFVTTVYNCRRHTHL